MERGNDSGAEAIKLAPILFKGSIGFDKSILRKFVKYISEHYFIKQITITMCINLCYKYMLCHRLMLLAVNSKMLNCKC